MKAGSGHTLVLASASVRRQQLLQQIGLNPYCRPASVDESVMQDESPQQLVSRLAELKATGCAAAIHSDLTVEGGCCVFLGADTVIDLDGQALGKPMDQADALSMLLALSAREHQVHTGVCVTNPAKDFIHTITVTTQVRFGEISPSDARRYWLTGEPAGKAGSYAIQGLGAQFVAQLSGSYSNVVGLPLFETAKLLHQAGINTL